MKIGRDGRVEVAAHPIDHNEKRFPFLLFEDVESEKTGFEVYAPGYPALIFFQDFRIRAVPQVAFVAPRRAALSGWSPGMKEAEIAARDGGIFALLTRPLAGCAASFSASESHGSYSPLQYDLQNNTKL
jgi:hypothetical protein